jgi:hypothetical protein
MSAAAVTDACYRASHKLLSLAGVHMRQCRLRKPVLLAGEP